MAVETSGTSRIFLGRFVKPFGIKGELKFVGSDDFWKDALSSKKLEVLRPSTSETRDNKICIERVRPHGNNFVMKLKGVDDRNGAEREVGSELFIDSGDLDVELPDKDLPFQVLGLVVKTEEGVVIGRITSVAFSAAHAVYTVEGEDGEVLIPAVPQIVVGRDEEAGEIVIRAIPGLLDD